MDGLRLKDKIVDSAAQNGPSAAGTRLIDGGVSQSQVKRLLHGGKMCVRASVPRA